MISISIEHCVNCGACGNICPSHSITKGKEHPIIHPGRNCIRCMHCAAVCPKQAIHFDFVPAYEEYLELPDDAFLRRIITRRSVRHFLPDAPNREDIAWALDMVQWAPSGKNAHTNRWLVIHGKEKCDTLYNTVVDLCAQNHILPELVVQREKGNHDSVTCGCSTVIFALAPKPLHAHIPTETDAVIAATTLDLLLQHIGIGTCWAGYLTWLIPALPGLQEYLGIPEDMMVAGTLLCGIPDETYRNIPWRPKATVEWR